MNTYLAAVANKGAIFYEVQAVDPEQAVHAYCALVNFSVRRVVVIHGDSATVYAVNEIKSLSVVRLGGY